MNIHKYAAPSISDAIAIVKNKLGSDALILSTKRIDRYENGQQFEITAIRADAENDNVTNDELKNELISIKEMVSILDYSNGLIEKMATNPSILKLYAKLIRNGVKTSYAGTFMKKGGALQDISEKETERKVKLNIIKEIMKEIDVSNPLEENNNGKNISALVGTTGVGKTTTIAKIAARLMLKSKKKSVLYQSTTIVSVRLSSLKPMRTYWAYPAFRHSAEKICYSQLNVLRIKM